MFVIPVIFNRKIPFIINLVSDIRKYHPYEKICVVDSNSDDKSYFDDIKQYDVIIEDISNKNWMIGAYWYIYKKYPNEEYYYMFHDSMRIKSNLDYLKESDLTLLFTFRRSPPFNTWKDRIINETTFKQFSDGNGCFGPIFMCKNIVMKKLFDAGVDKLLPTNKHEVGYCEGSYGFFFESLGYDLTKCNLYGDILSGKAHHGNTQWEYPIEKMYGHTHALEHGDERRGTF